MVFPRKRIKQAFRRQAKARKMDKQAFHPPRVKAHKFARNSTPENKQAARAACHLGKANTYRV
jgi:hypothetical protein